MAATVWAHVSTCALCRSQQRIVMDLYLSALVAGYGGPGAKGCPVTRDGSVKSAVLRLPSEGADGGGGATSRGGSGISPPRLQKLDARVPAAVRLRVVIGDLLTACPRTALVRQQRASATMTVAGVSLLPIPGNDVSVVLTNKCCQNIAASVSL